MRERGRVTGPLGLILPISILLGGASCQHMSGPPSSDPEIRRVRNFGVVQEGVLYRGADPGALALNELKTSKYKIKTVVNLNVLDDDQQSLDAESLQYFHFPICLVPEVHLGGGDVRQIKRFLEVVRDPKNQPVFVHDTFGANRTGEAVGYYEILDEHKSFDEVKRDLYEHHYCDKVYPYILKRLQELAFDATPAGAEPNAEATTQPAP